MEVTEEEHNNQEVAEPDEELTAPHTWLSDGRLLFLHEARHADNLKAFQSRWEKGEPVMVGRVNERLTQGLWTPESFGEEFGEERADVVNTKNGVIIDNMPVWKFWKGFESMKDRPRDASHGSMLLKLKDWPPGADFSEKLPKRFNDLMSCLPLPEYTSRSGNRNLVSRLPNFFSKPDLGPKMYNAYGSASFPQAGTTNLHIDMSDAVNVMVYVGYPRDGEYGDIEMEEALKQVDIVCCKTTRKRVDDNNLRPGALWHIYRAEDANTIRTMLHKVSEERGLEYPKNHDPIHDQCFYLDGKLRKRLKKDYNIDGWAITQCLGDAVFVPAGAPHQVRNLHSCIKIAEDFVSPEHIEHCFTVTQQFRYLTEKHTNHEDKLQVKNIIYHAVKDSVAVLNREKEKLN